MRETFSYYVTKLYRDFFSYAAAELGKLGLSYGSLPFIIYIGKFPDCSQAELTEGLRMDWGHTQRSIAKLVQGGFVTKEKRKDGKAYHLNLTGQGKEAFRVSHDVFTEWNDEKMKNLSSAEREQLFGILKKLISAAGKESYPMKQAVIYSSETGNTKKLAEAVKECIPEKDLVYFGEPGGQVPEADFLYIGFWTDRGVCDRKTAEFLKTLRGKKLFLFGTAGFGGSDAYYKRILEETAKLADETCEVAGTFMCQGKMPGSVRERYVKMAETQGETPELKAQIENFDRGLSHPDRADLDALKERVKETAVR